MLKAHFKIKYPLHFKVSYYMFLHADIFLKNFLPVHNVLNSYRLFLYIEIPYLLIAYPSLNKLVVSN